MNEKAIFERLGWVGGEASNVYRERLSDDQKIRLVLLTFEAAYREAQPKMTMNAAWLAYVEGWRRGRK